MTGTGRIQPITEASLAQAAALLRAGELVAFPTETVYGLGANACDEAAVRRIYAAKGRPAHNPLIVHVPDVAAARVAAGVFSDRAEALAAALWPGPITLVVPRGPRIAALVSAGLPTVALRVPGHADALRLLRACGLPIAAPSANRSEGLSPTTAEHVGKSLPDVPLILDGGPCRLGIESTVVDLCGPRPRLLRPGALPLRVLRALLPDLDLPVLSEGHPGAALPSPGMMARHYAPRARLLVVAALSQIDLAALPGPVGVLVHGGEASADVVEVLPADPAGYGADLYAALHRLDDAGVATIVVEAPPAGEDWGAVADRLRRASTPS